MNAQEQDKLRKQRIKDQIRLMRDSVMRMEVFADRDAKDELDAEARTMENEALELRELLIGVA